MSFTHNLITRQREDEEGFTLIELMVVVLIIAILIAIAIPTFLGARQRAQDRAAESNLRNALTAEKTFFTDASTYASSTDTDSTGSAALADIEPSLKWVADSGTLTVGQVNVADPIKNSVDKDTVCLEAKSASGTTFAVADISAGTNAGTYYTSKTDGSQLCNSSLATMKGWGTKW